MGEEKRIFLSRMRDDFEEDEFEEFMDLSKEDQIVRQKTFADQRIAEIDTALANLETKKQSLIKEKNDVQRIKNNL